MIYRVMVLFDTPDGWKEADTGYHSDDLDTADDLRYALIRRNPKMEFIVHAMERERR